MNSTQIVRNRLLPLLVAICLATSAALAYWNVSVTGQATTLFDQRARATQALADLKRNQSPALAASPTDLSNHSVDAISRAAETRKVQITSLSLEPRGQNAGLSTGVLEMRGSYTGVKATLADFLGGNEGVAISNLTLRRVNQSADIEVRATLVSGSGGRS